MLKAGREAAAERWRDWLIGLAAGAALLGFVLFAVSQTGRRAVSANPVAEGVIIAKRALPRADTQITVGRGGLRARETVGEFTVRVDAGNGREYRVPVDQGTFETRQVGDRLVFRR